MSLTIREAANTINCRLLMCASQLCQTSRREGVQLSMRDALTCIRAAVDGMIEVVDAAEGEVIVQ